mgnify:CR=1 FL=1
MKIETSPRPAARPRGPAEKESSADDAFWREFGNDVREVLLHTDSEKLHTLGTAINGLRQGLRGVWKALRDIPERLLEHEVVKDKVDLDTRERWLEISETVGLVAGLAAAGGQAVLGCGKLVSGFKQKNTGRKLDGLVDLATATTLALTVAGLGAARLVVAPIAASINVLRGGYNAVAGFKQNDERKQLQGMLDVTRSIGGLGRIFRRRSPLANVVGIAFAPIAGALQAGRGLRDVSIGLKNDDNKKVVRGLVDVATAVGTTMAFASGMAVIPGVVLAVTANAAKVAYQLSPKFRGVVDARIDKHEDRLESIVDTATRWSAPVIKGWRSLMGKLVKNVDELAPASLSKAQLVDITRLMHEDGKYSREEQKRLRVALERVGQGSDTPSRKGPPPESQRSQLIDELKTPEQRKSFVGFMLAVADYEQAILPEEEAYCRQLARDLAVPDGEFEEMLQDQQRVSAMPA